MAIEQEVKLRFDTTDAARRAIAIAGGRLETGRRLIDDQLFDSDASDLRRSGRGLRVRRDGAGVAYLTYKGPVVAGPVKSREELETTVGDAEVVEAALGGLGFLPRFRAQKYREEYLLGRGHVVIDDTPMGTFVEIEATPDEIERIARLLGRAPADYMLDSYASLWQRWCRERGGDATAMLFREP